MIQCIVIDDEPLAIDVLEDYIRKTPFLQLAASFDDPLEAITYLNNHKAGLIFLDIQMPEITGLQFMKLLKEPTPVIFTTAYKQFALDGYEFDIVDYLLKPIPFDRFLKAVQKVMDRKPVIQSPIANTPSSKIDFVFIKTDTRLVKVVLSDILYIEGKKDYIAVVTNSGELITLQNMKKIEEDLPAGQFIRVHKSFIVALSKIQTIENNRLFIGDAVIPIGDTYRKHFFDMIEKNKLS